MNDFIFHNPAKVYFGKNQIGHLPEEILKIGKRVLMVYGGGSIKKNGLYDTVKKLLDENGIETFELSGVEPNPRHTTANKGAQICKKYIRHTYVISSFYHIPTYKRSAHSSVKPAVGTCQLHYLWLQYIYIVIYFRRMCHYFSCIGMRKSQREYYGYAHFYGTLKESSLCFIIVSPQQRRFCSCHQNIKTHYVLPRRPHAPCHRNKIVVPGVPHSIL